MSPLSTLSTLPPIVTRVPGRKCVRIVYSVCVYFLNHHQNIQTSLAVSVWTLYLSPSARQPESGLTSVLLCGRAVVLSVSGYSAFSINLPKLRIIRYLVVWRFQNSNCSEVSQCPLMTAPLCSGASPGPRRAAADVCRHGHSHSLLQ